MAWRCIGSALSGYSWARIQQGQAGTEAWILMLSSPRNISTSCLFCLSVSSPCTAILVFCLFVFMPLHTFILSREVITTLLYWHQPSLISTHLDHLCEYFCGKGITASRVTLAKSWSSNPFHIQQLLLSVTEPETSQFCQPMPALHLIPNLLISSRYMLIFPHP